MKRFFLFILCLALSVIWIPQFASAETEAQDNRTTLTKGPELIFGNEPLPFPQNSQLRRIFSELNANDNRIYLADINLEDHEVKQILTLFNNLFNSSDVIFYQALIPVDSGYQQAFLVTVQLPKENFIKSQWGALFPDPEPNTLLEIYQNEFRSKLSRNNGNPIPLSLGDREKVSLLRLTEPIQMGTRNHSLVSSHSVSFVAEFTNFSIPIYYHQWGWTIDDQYYLVLLISLDGERDFWENYSSKHFSSPYKKSHRSM